MIVRTFEEAQQYVAALFPAESPAPGGRENDDAFLVNTIVNGYASNVWILVPRNREFEQAEFLSPPQSGRYWNEMVEVGDWSSFPEYYPV